MLSLAVALGFAACAAESVPPPTASAPAEQPKTETIAVETFDGGALIAATVSGAQAFRPGDEGIVHIQSGMTCKQTNKSRSIVLERLFVFPGDTPGDDVGCDYAVFVGDQGTAGKVTLYATRNWGLSASDYLAASVEQIYAFHGAVEPRQVPVPSFDELGPIEGQGFTVTMNGQRAQSGVWVTVVGDWLVKVRATYPMPEDGADPVKTIQADVLFATWIILPALAIKQAALD